MRGERYYCLYLYKVSAIIVSVHCTIRKNIILYDLFLYSRVVHSLLLAIQIVTSVFCDPANRDVEKIIKLFILTRKRTQNKRGRKGNER